MIKVRVCLEDELDNKRMTGGAGREVEAYGPELVSREIMQRGADGSLQPPFRDEESLRLLEFFDIGYVEGDWYSVLDRRSGERLPVWAMRQEALYALCLMACSKRGKYLSFRRCGDRVWDELVQMPFDILVAFRRSDLKGSRQVGGHDYRIVNYPLNGQEVELTVKNSLISPQTDAFYSALPGYKEYGTSYGVCRGADGRYYTDSFYIFEALHYFWIDDLDNIVRYVRDHGRRRKSVARQLRLFEWYEGLGLERRWWSSYLSRLESLKQDLEHKFIDQEEYQKKLQELQESEEYREHLYLKNEYKVVDHSVDELGRCTFRKLSLLILDRKQDGSWHLHNDLSWLNNRLDGIAKQAVSMRSPDYERFVLPVNVDRRLASREDFRHTVCGFLIREDGLEMYDADEALKVFASRIQAALDSGRYTVSREVIAQD